MPFGAGNNKNTSIMDTIICYVKDFKNNTCFKIEMQYVDNFGRNYELINGSNIYIFNQLPLFDEEPKEPVYFENLTKQKTLS